MIGLKIQRIVFYYLQFILIQLICQVVISYKILNKLIIGIM